MQYDASQLAPGSQFNCTNCGTLVTYGQQPQAPRGRAAPAGKVPQRGPGAMTRGPRGPQARGPQARMPQQQAAYQQPGPYGQQQQQPGRGFPQPKKSNTGLVVGIIVGVVALVLILVLVLASGGGGGGVDQQLEADIQQVLALSTSNQQVLPAEVITRLDNAMAANLVPEEQVKDVTAKLAFAKRIVLSADKNAKNEEIKEKQAAAEKAARQVGDSFIKALRAGDKAGMAATLNLSAYHKNIQGKGTMGSEPFKRMSTYNYTYEVTKNGYIETIDFGEPYSPDQLSNVGLDYILEMFGPAEGRSLDPVYVSDKDSGQTVFNDPLTTSYYQVTLNIDVKEPNEKYPYTKPFQVIIQGDWGGPAKVVLLNETSHGIWTKRKTHENQLNRPDTDRGPSTTIEGEGGPEEFAGPKLAGPPAREDYDGQPVQKMDVESIAGTPMEKTLQAIGRGNPTRDDDTRLLSYVSNPDTLALFFGQLVNTLIKAKQMAQESEKSNICQNTWTLIERTCRKTLGDEWMDFIQFQRGIDDRGDDYNEHINVAAWRYSQLHLALKQYAKEKADYLENGGEED